MDPTEGQDPDEALVLCRTWVIPASPTAPQPLARIDTAGLKQHFKSLWRFVHFVNYYSTDCSDTHTKVGSKEILSASQLLNYKVLWVKCAECL